MIEELARHGYKLGAGTLYPAWTSAVLGPRHFALALAGILLLAVWKAPPSTARIKTCTCGKGRRLPNATLRLIIHPARVSRGALRSGQNQKRERFHIIAEYFTQVYLRGLKSLEFFQKIAVEGARRDH